MKHIYRGYTKTLPIPLADACTPFTDPYSGGALEQAAGQAALNARVIGKMLAWMVENSGMSLDTAHDICEDYMKWTEVEEK